MYSKSYRYAIHALICLAEDEAHYHSAKDIAEKALLPAPYISKLLHEFVRAGLVKSKKGKHGGFSLAKVPNEITLLDVFESIHGAHGIERCMLCVQGCDSLNTCLYKSLFGSLKYDLNALMQLVSLGDLVKMRVPQSLLPN